MRNKSDTWTVGYKITSTVGQILKNCLLSIASLRSSSYLTLRSGGRRSHVNVRSSEGLPPRERDPLRLVKYNGEVWPIRPSSLEPRWDTQKCGGSCANYWKLLSTA